MDSVKSKPRKTGTSKTFLKDRLDQVSTDREEVHDCFRQMAESMQDVFFLLEWPGRKPLYITPSFERFWNFKPGEAYRQPDQWLDTVHPEDRAHVEQALTGDLSPNGLDIEYRLLRPNGLVNWIQDRWFPITDDTGRARQMIRQVTDITQRKQNECTLRRLATVVTDSNDAVTLMDLSGRIKAWNRGAERLYGYTEAEALGMSVFQTIPDEQREAFRCLIDRIEQGQLVDSCETQRWHSDGRLLDIWLTIAPLLDETDQITAVATTERDITERKANEVSAMKYQQKLKALASEMTLAEERLKCQVATHLHDTIGQSLAFSKFKFQLLVETVSDNETRATLVLICEIIDQALTASRSLTCQLSYPVLTVLGLERGIERWLDDEITTKHGIQTHFIADTHEKPLDEDMRLVLFRGVRELLNNVIKHARATQVTVSVQRVDTHILITVEDNGTGCDPTDAMIKERGQFWFVKHPRSSGTVGREPTTRHLPGPRMPGDVECPPGPDCDQSRPQVLRW